jgi:sortase (surface protein transpeptidase)
MSKNEIEKKKSSQPELTLLTCDPWHEIEIKKYF